MNKILKKIIVFLLFAVLIAALFSISVFADDSENTDQVDEEVPAVTETNSDNYTLVGRLWEFVEDNKEIIVTGSLGVILLAMDAITAVKGKKKTKELFSKLSSVATDTSTVSQSQGSIVDVVNLLIESFNNLKTTYEQHEKEEDERSHTSTLIALVSITIFEMQHQTYQSNRNLPQGIKDVCSLRYAKCLELIKSDEQVKAVYDSVHALISNHKEDDGNVAPK